MSLQNIRKEVMRTLEDNIDTFVDKFLITPEKIWQPTDFLPNSQKDTFINEVEEIREISKELDDDFWVVLVGDTITEEALPTYESWLLDIDGVHQHPDNGWAKWLRAWTAEENRHGDVLNKYLYLSGRVNMREVEITTQHLIADGFDIGTASDPYKNFVYTSFQELATYISHNNVAKIARKKGHKALAKMSKIIAAPMTQTINLEALSSHICIDAVSHELVERAAKIGFTLFARALKIVKMTKAFTIFVAMSPIKPERGNIKVQMYKAIVIGTNPIGLLSALRISSSIFDFVLLASLSRELRIIEIIKPLKSNAINITINDEIIAPRFIPKKPLFHTSERSSIKFSIFKFAVN